MVGGAGADDFVFGEAGSADSARVDDFVSGTDDLVFNRSFFTGLGAAGDWTAGDVRFFSGSGATTAHDSDDRLVYNTTTGALYYDADGAGGAAAQIVATLTGVPAVNASDVTVA